MKQFVRSANHGAVGVGVAVNSCQALLFGEHVDEPSARTTFTATDVLPPGAGERRVLLHLSQIAHTLQQRHLELKGTEEARTPQSIAECAREQTQK